MGATMKNLEVQIGQLATTINAQQIGTFHSNTEVNPKEQCKAITLRNGREIERSPSKETKFTPIDANNGQNKNKAEEEEIVDDTLRDTGMLPAISFPDNPLILSTPLPYPQHALEQMPNYVKFMKDIISKKTRKLGLGEMKQTTISLQLAYQSIKYPCGIIEDILVKVDKFIFPIDFMVLDMEEDQEVPLILGRPFLAMGRALIDVQKGELTLRVNKKEVMFNIYQAMRFPEDPSTCFQAFNAIKEKLVSAPIMIVPDWNQPFEVMCDASDFAIGAILGQRRDKLFRAIYYASLTLNEAQLNYTTTEKEILVVVFACDKFQSYLIGTKFDLEIRDMKGSENSVADHLSRVEQEEVRSDSVIQEVFPDEQLFACEIKLPWYADIVNYLACKVLPPDLTYHQSQKFLHDVKYYLWDEPLLFKRCPDQIIRRCVLEEEMH
ncbi:hypothetical protein VitviT2T_023244 [Vitis vinifera]|uniref:Reverse transcriptase/retrotransposon-derived protein RNase H-like domain-containing protein n=1 Tax=Vitis vinifera TaxID=29760 RepID=A0ABY9DC64_VITVI|nr:hypothetical protein VitviT2T_023244 [Vitis vinifera]